MSIQLLEYFENKLYQSTKFEVVYTEHEDEGRIRYDIVNKHYLGDQSIWFNWNALEPHLEGNLPKQLEEPINKIIKNDIMEIVNFINFVEV